MASEVGERFVIGIVGGDDSVDVVNGKSLIDRVVAYAFASQSAEERS